jgi:hypothetical protein
MSIEQGFRDWKTHLGVRGLVFRTADPAPHLTRLLLAFSLSYLLCLALGATEEATQVRAFVEIPRRKPRHGTTRTLSALSIGMIRLSLPQFAFQAKREILKILMTLSKGEASSPIALRPSKKLSLSTYLKNPFLPRRDHCLYSFQKATAKLLPPPSHSLSHLKTSTSTTSTATFPFLE